MLVPWSTLWNWSGSLGSLATSFDLADAISDPGAVTSGFIRPSLVGPQELKDAIPPVEAEVDPKT